MSRVPAMEPVPNPLIASSMQFSPVPNPLLPGAKDKAAPVPDPLSSFAYGDARDMSPSSTMIHLNDHFAGGDSAAFISDDGESMFYLSDFEPTNVLNDARTYPYPDSDAGDTFVFPTSTAYSNRESANIPITPAHREAKVAAEMHSYSSPVIVDDDSSKEGRLSPEGEGTTSSGEETKLATPGPTTGARSSVAPGAVKSKKRKYRTGNDARMNEQRKVERRERNREHAKKSRIRKKSFMESMQQAAALLREENAKIRGAIHARLGDETAQAVLQAKFAGPNVDGQHASPILEGSRCSESVVASARELAVKVAMNNLKEIAAEGGGTSSSVNG